MMKQDPHIFDIESRALKGSITFILKTSHYHSNFQLISISANSRLNSMDLDSEPESKVNSMDSDSEPECKLISLIDRLIALYPKPDSFDFTSDWWRSAMTALTCQISSLVRSMDMDSQPTLETELISLISQTISVVSSMDLDSQPKPLSELISLVDQKLNLRPKPNSDEDLGSLSNQTLVLEPEPELMSLLHQICFLVIHMNLEWRKLISLCPQLEVLFKKERRSCVKGKIKRTSNNKWDCRPENWEKFSSTGVDDTHFLCGGCRGENHENFQKAPVEIRHSLHPKHSLQLALKHWHSSKRKCYCCDEDVKRFFYYCSVCDFALNIACSEKPPVLLLSIDHPKWHDHTLAHFPRQVPLTCDMCALVDSSSPIYICLPCDFIVHQRCLSLPHVIRISRHLHRISFTHSFDQGDLTCGVCRRKIDNNYGGYSCIKDGCSYAAHSKCATQENVWDGIDLEGVPEEIEEVLEPFVRISDGIIQHFSHEHHHLRLDEDTSRDYDEDKLCQACTTPIYFGNFYSCMQCNYILHETCANLSRKIHHPIHPHLVTLVGGYDGVMDYSEGTCSACFRICTTSFFYECGKEGCDFKLDVQCATISEPLVHESHMHHPLFLTSKPGEGGRKCGFCKDCERYLEETLNCIDCDFGLCFECATLPHQLRYKHDKHMLTLSYGEETSTMIYWCEACEGTINPKERFYKCDEYCCVTLHIGCLIGRDLYVKPGSSYIRRDGVKVSILPNNHHMSRPICSSTVCKIRCPYKVVFQLRGEIFCSVSCTWDR